MSNVLVLSTPLLARVKRFDKMRQTGASQHVVGSMSMLVTSKDH
jgi:hypothetical protein